ncbi:uncharacterized protein AMSG_00836 [Thecamonas trahens ATCC 50062]|uniref:Uncharacterized protein n=1 Tax=Thecamonas trahens ATCC 50062 TaxID=461836 RepID=A0A0L0DEV9_THETB|nr:hypothetical protein AMSG_00836 [Thecamonas trahens ATCC 50062]KNC50676.1 hypothetical protein AMSG_00836 [Thecamonas trahens ATCC 50062]|eukprot:XP_013762556.1 hypothetical protein AMSG_00836 [Thecamonas trahens ATCC 50062]
MEAVLDDVRLCEAMALALTHPQLHAAHNTQLPSLSLLSPDAIVAAVNVLAEAPFKPHVVHLAAALASAWLLALAELPDDAQLAGLADPLLGLLSLADRVSSRVRRSAPLALRFYAAELTAAVHALEARLLGTAAPAPLLDEALSAALGPKADIPLALNQVLAAPSAWYGAVLLVRAATPSLLSPAPHAAAAVLVALDAARANLASKVLISTCQALALATAACPSVDRAVALVAGSSASGGLPLGLADLAVYDACHAANHNADVCSAASAAIAFVRSELPTPRPALAAALADAESLNAPAPTGNIGYAAQVEAAAAIAEPAYADSLAKHLAAREQDLEVKLQKTAASLSDEVVHSATLTQDLASTRAELDEYKARHAAACSRVEELEATTTGLAAELAETRDALAAQTRATRAAELLRTMAEAELLSRSSQPVSAPPTPPRSPSPTPRHEIGVTHLQALNSRLELLQAENAELLKANKKASGLRARLRQVQAANDELEDAMAATRSDVVAAQVRLTSLEKALTGEMLAHDNTLASHLATLGDLLRTLDAPLADSLSASSTPQLGSNASTPSEGADVLDRLRLVQWRREHVIQQIQIQAHQLEDLLARLSSSVVAQSTSIDSLTSRLELVDAARREADAQVGQLTEHLNVGLAQEASLLEGKEAAEKALDDLRSSLSAVVANQAAATSLTTSRSSASSALLTAAISKASDVAAQLTLDAASTHAALDALTVADSDATTVAASSLALSSTLAAHEPPAVQESLDELDAEYQAALDAFRSLQDSLPEETDVRDTLVAQSELLGKLARLGAERQAVLETALSNALASVAATHDSTHAATEDRIAALAARIEAARASSADGRDALLASRQDAARLLEHMSMMQGLLLAEQVSAFKTLQAREADLLALLSSVAASPSETSSVRASWDEYTLSLAEFEALVSVPDLEPAFAVVAEAEAETTAARAAQLSASSALLDVKIAALRAAAGALENTLNDSASALNRSASFDAVSFESAQAALHAEADADAQLDALRAQAEANVAAGNAVANFIARVAAELAATGSPLDRALANVDAARASVNAAALSQATAAKETANDAVAAMLQQLSGATSKGVKARIRLETSLATSRAEATAAASRSAAAAKLALLDRLAAALTDAAPTSEAAVEAVIADFRAEHVARASEADETATQLAAAALADHQARLKTIDDPQLFDATMAEIAALKTRASHAHFERLDELHTHVALIESASVANVLARADAVQAATAKLLAESAAATERSELDLRTQLQSKLTGIMAELETKKLSERRQGQLLAAMAEAKARSVAEIDALHHAHQRCAAAAEALLASSCTAAVAQSSPLPQYTRSLASALRDAATDVGGEARKLRDSLTKTRLDSASVRSVLHAVEELSERYEAELDRIHDAGHDQLAAELSASQKATSAKVSHIANKLRAAREAAMDRGARNLDMLKLQLAAGPSASRSPRGVALAADATEELAGQLGEVQDELSRVRHEANESQFQLHRLHALTTAQLRSMADDDGDAPSPNGTEPDYFAYTIGASLAQALADADARMARLALAHKAEKSVLEARLADAGSDGEARAVEAALEDKAIIHDAVHAAHVIVRRAIVDAQGVPPTQAARALREARGRLADIYAAKAEAYTTGMTATLAGVQAELAVAEPGSARAKVLTQRVDDLQREANVWHRAAETGRTAADGQLGRLLEFMMEAEAAQDDAERVAADSVVRRVAQRERSASRETEALLRAMPGSQSDGPAAARTVAHLRQRQTRSNSIHSAHLAAVRERLDELKTVQPSPNLNESRRMFAETQRALHQMVALADEHAIEQDARIASLVDQLALATKERAVLAADARELRESRTQLAAQVSRLSALHEADLKAQASSLDALLTEMTSASGVAPTAGPRFEDMAAEAPWQARTRAQPQAQAQENHTQPDDDTPLVATLAPASVVAAPAPALPAASLDDVLGVLGDHYEALREANALSTSAMLADIATHAAQAGAGPVQAQVCAELSRAAEAAGAERDSVLVAKIEFLARAKAEAGVWAAASGAPLSDLGALLTAASQRVQGEFEATSAEVARAADAEIAALSRQLLEVTKPAQQAKLMAKLEGAREAKAASLASLDASNDVAADVLSDMLAEHRAAMVPAEVAVKMGVPAPDAAETRARVAALREALAACESSGRADLAETRRIVLEAEEVARAHDHGLVARASAVEHAVARLKGAELEAGMEAAAEWRQAAHATSIDMVKTLRDELAASKAALAELEVRTQTTSQSLLNTRRELDEEQSQLNQSRKTLDETNQVLQATQDALAMLDSTLAEQASSALADLNAALANAGLDEARAAGSSALFEVSSRPESSSAAVADARRLSKSGTSVADTFATLEAGLARSTEAIASLSEALRTSESGLDTSRARCLALLGERDAALDAVDDLAAMLRWYAAEAVDAGRSRVGMLDELRVAVSNADGVANNDVAVNKTETELCRKAHGVTSWLREPLLPVPFEAALASTIRLLESQAEVLGRLAEVESSVGESLDVADTTLLVPAGGAKAVAESLVAARVVAEALSNSPTPAQAIDALDEVEAKAGQTEGGRQVVAMLRHLVSGQRALAPQAYVRRWAYQLARSRADSARVSRVLDKVHAVGGGERGLRLARTLLGVPPEVTEAETSRQTEAMHEANSVCKHVSEQAHSVMAGLEAAGDEGAAAVREVIREHDAAAAERLDLLAHLQAVLRSEIEAEDLGQGHDADDHSDVEDNVVAVRSGDGQLVPLTVSAATVDEVEPAAMMLRRRLRGLAHEPGHSVESAVEEVDAVFEGLPSEHPAVLGAKLESVRVYHAQRRAANATALLQASQQLAKAQSSVRLDGTVSPGLMRTVKNAKAALQRELKRAQTETALLQEIEAETKASIASESLRVVSKEEEALGPDELQQLVGSLKSRVRRLARLEEVQVSNQNASGEVVSAVSALLLDEMDATRRLQHEKQMMEEEAAAAEEDKAQLAHSLYAAQNELASFKASAEHRKAIAVMESRLEELEAAAAEDPDNAELQAALAALRDELAAKEAEYELELALAKEIEAGFLAVKQKIHVTGRKERAALENERAQSAAMYDELLVEVEDLEAKVVALDAENSTLKRKLFQQGRRLSTSSGSVANEESRLAVIAAARAAREKQVSLKAKVTELESMLRVKSAMKPRAAAARSLNATP